MSAETIPARLVRQAHRQPDRPAYYVRHSTGWIPTRWDRYLNEVRRASRALLTLGIEERQVCCILSFNRPEWIVASQAAMMAGGIGAGIYTTSSPDEVAYIVAHSEAPIVFVENVEQWGKIAKMRDELPALRHVVLFDGRVDDPMVLTWSDFLRQAERTDQHLLDQRLAELRETDIAQYIYTSGTTGPPKAVMLSHRNLVWTAETAVRLIALRPEDTVLSYLPLSHVAEQMFTIHGPTIAGFSVHFAESMDKLPDNLREVQPTLLFGVPRVWEKFEAGIRGRLAQASPARRRLAKWAQRVGAEVNALRMRGESPRGRLAIEYRLARNLVFGRLRQALGLGRARLCVSGAAPIATSVLEFFAGFDLPILEIYGQSEDCGPTTFNLPNAYRFGTVGRRLPGVEVRIADDGEILVRGPNVFVGYAKDEAATRATVIDGWLHSGDLGAFDADGFLTITGRKKEILITAGGKNIAPKNIEAALKGHAFIAEAVVIGDRRKFLSALLVLDEAAVDRFGAAQGWTGPWGAHPGVLAEIQRAVDATNEHFASVEHVRAWRVLDRPLSIAAGELTPTLKIKRRNVEENFRALIDAIYAEVPTTG